MSTNEQQSRLLVIWHSRTGAAGAMAQAAHEAADPSSRLVEAEHASPEELLDAAGYLFVCPENLAAMTGMMKEMFDRCYYPLLGRIEGRPYATAIAASAPKGWRASTRETRARPTTRRCRPVAVPEPKAKPASTATAAPRVWCATDRFALRRRWPVSRAPRGSARRVCSAIGTSACAWNLRPVSASRARSASVRSACGATSRRIPRASAWRSGPWLKPAAVTPSATAATAHAGTACRAQSSAKTAARPRRAPRAWSATEQPASSRKPAARPSASTTAGSAYLRPTATKRRAPGP